MRPQSLGQILEECVHPEAATASTVTPSAPVAPRIAHTPARPPKNVYAVDMAI
ncbi:hypothetical protein QCN29_20915 [Streptomyces sp. HNM0663]|uniref:Uncharacterized protein n=1 Tax=Streptomyces chengmaiensis TaxID=3040919 RepID=A0ABT6HRG8_9ACTN|nr:hypothetical protein [Streptomyces chengmaiensis]MDH2391205.1 hypothetical protein [Streptomyces chengmaiensis]